jgi:hypothetical protein
VFLLLLCVYMSEHQNFYGQSSTFSIVNAEKRKKRDMENVGVQKRYDF